MQPKDFANPIVNIQNAPSAPDPSGLQSLIQLLSKGDSFRDLTGLNQNQLNALSAFQSSLQSAQAFGKEAADLAKEAGKLDLQKSMTKDYDKTIKAIRNSNLPPEKKAELEEKALNALIGGGAQPTITQPQEIEREIEMLNTLKDKGIISNTEMNSLAKKIIEKKGGIDQITNEIKKPISQQPGIRESLDGATKISYKSSDGESLQVERANAQGTSVSKNINFDIIGTVPRIEQPSNNTCWAATLAMMVSWLEDKTTSIEDVMTYAGDFFKVKYKDDIPLFQHEKEMLLPRFNLMGERAGEMSSLFLFEKLRKHGPIWITTDEATGAEFSVHARIITGIYGDGETLEKTFVKIVDPSPLSEGQYEESLNELFSKFYEVANKELSLGRLPRIQLVYFNPDSKERFKNYDSNASSNSAISKIFGDFLPGEGGIDEYDFPPDRVFKEGKSLDIDYAQEIASDDAQRAKAAGSGLSLKIKHWIAQSLYYFKGDALEKYKENFEIIAGFEPEYCFWLLDIKKFTDSELQKLASEEFIKDKIELVYLHKGHNLFSSGYFLNDVINKMKFFQERNITDYQKNITSALTTLCTTERVNLFEKINSLFGKRIQAVNFFLNQVKEIDRPSNSLFDSIVIELASIALNVVTAGIGGFIAGKALGVLTNNFGTVVDGSVTKELSSALEESFTNTISTAFTEAAAASKDSLILLMSNSTSRDPKNAFFESQTKFLEMKRDEASSHIRTNIESTYDPMISPYGCLAQYFSIGQSLDKALDTNVHEKQQISSLKKWLSLLAIGDLQNKVDKYKTWDKTTTPVIYPVNHITYYPFPETHIGRREEWDGILYLFAEVSSETAFYNPNQKLNLSAARIDGLNDTLRTILKTVVLWDENEQSIPIVMVIMAKSNNTNKFMCSFGINEDKEIFIQYESHDKENKYGINPLTSIYNLSKRAYEGRSLDGLNDRVIIALAKEAAESIALELFKGKSISDHDRSLGDFALDILPW